MKNFVKLIKQVHEERFSVILSKILLKKIPVTFFLTEPVAQAVEIVKKFSTQGFDITTLLVIDSTPPQSTLNSTL